jgi:hypothetical protein
MIPVAVAEHAHVVAGIVCFDTLDTIAWMNTPGLTSPKHLSMALWSRCLHNVTFVSLQAASWSSVDEEGPGDI